MVARAPEQNAPEIAGSGGIALPNGGLPSQEIKGILQL